MVAQAAIKHLLRILALDDPTRVLPLSKPYGTLLAEYDCSLRQTCGLAEQTCLYRLRNARAFLRRCFADESADFSRLRPSDLQDYFRRHAGHLEPGSVAVLADSLRSFLRFLALAHGTDPALAGAVPGAPRWPLDRLPRSLPAQDGILNDPLRHLRCSQARGIHTDALHPEFQCQGASQVRHSTL